MNNPFSIDSLTPTWAITTPILKGDLPGHPFRGNQYTAGSLAEKAGALARPGGGAIALRGQAPGLIEGHLDVAQGHIKLAQKAFAEGKAELGQAHLTAAHKHTDVGRSMGKATQPNGNPNPDGMLRNAHIGADLAERYSKQAAEMESNP